MGRLADQLNALDPNKTGVFYGATRTSRNGAFTQSVGLFEKPDSDLGIWNNVLSHVDLRGNSFKAITFPASFFDTVFQKTLTPTGRRQLLFADTWQDMKNNLIIFGWDIFPAPPPPPIEKLLGIRGADPLLIIPNNIISYQFRVTGQIRKGSSAGPGDIISLDGKSVKGTILLNGFDDWLFTGDFISLTANGHLITTLAGIEFPNDSIMATPAPEPEPKVEKFLEIRGNDPFITTELLYEIVVSEQIRKGPGAGTREEISADGKTATGKIGVPGSGMDGFFFTGVIVSTFFTGSVITTIDGKDLPNNSPDPTPEPLPEPEPEPEPEPTGLSTLQKILIGLSAAGVAVISAVAITSGRK